MSTSSGLRSILATQKIISISESLRTLQQSYKIPMSCMRGLHAVTLPSKRNVSPDKSTQLSADR